MFERQILEREGLSGTYANLRKFRANSLDPWPLRDELQGRVEILEEVILDLVSMIRITVPED